MTKKDSNSRRPGDRMSSGKDAGFSMPEQDGKTVARKGDAGASVHGQAMVTDTRELDGQNIGTDIRERDRQKEKSPGGLRSLVPGYRSREEVLQEISSNPAMLETFNSWKEEQQEEFLDFCSGNRGVKILYDSFFKYVFDPDSGKAPLMRLISILIEQDVNNITILPNESRLAADCGLVIMDIIVETADGSIVNIEVQKIGFMFPGERAACYSADLLLRQYRRVRKEAAEQARIQEQNKESGRFSYKNIHPVFTIVLMETSTKIFHEKKEVFFHRFSLKSDTGLELNLLQNYIFISLDIFKEHLRNKGITTERDAWLAFLSCDDPIVISTILDLFPDIFRELYERICDLCRNTEEVMNMFSKELAELDRNTTLLMIEEMQNKIDEQDQALHQTKEELQQAKEENQQKDAVIATLERRLAALEAKLSKEV